MPAAEHVGSDLLESAVSESVKTGHGRKKINTAQRKAKCRKTKFEKANWVAA